MYFCNDNYAFILLLTEFLMNDIRSIDDLNKF